MKRNIKLITHNNPNLEENPFSIKANPKVIGLEKQKKFLIQYIKNGDVCFLTGPTGVGKSSLLLWIKNNLNPYHVFYIDAADVEKSFGIKEFIKNSRRGFDRFRAYPKNTVVLLDESQDCDYELQKALKLHWDHGHIKSIVITQIDQNLKNFSDSFNDRIGRRIIELGKLNKLDAINLINLRLGNKKLFDEKAIEKIIEIADYIPRKILEFCELVYLKNKDKKKIELVDVKKVLREKNRNIKQKSKQSTENQINKQQESNETRETPKPTPRLTLLQKKITKDLGKGKTIEEISKDLRMPLEKVKEELNNLQDLDVVTAQEQKIYLTK
ncbi:MAG: ATP-binding protein [Nanoarchaeota archaeon]|nr:ATP-binding protein [Nanoarchaeota archaeon]